MTIENILETLQNHSYFQRLRKVIEHVIEGDKVWHDHEPVYNHSINTLRIAKERLAGDFIINPKAKDLFLQWVDTDIYETKQKDLTLITALIHDCGKILSYKEGDRLETLITANPNFPEQRFCPGHEYWGAKLVVPELLKEIDISEKAKMYIQLMIEYHGFFSNPYFPSRQSWTLGHLLSNVKSQYAGYYIEGLFNMYCDGYSASAFELGKKKIEELFNEPFFYEKRTYILTK